MAEENGRVTTKEVYSLLSDTRKELSEKIEQLENKVDNKYITRNEHMASLERLSAEIYPLKRLVYGTAAAVISMIVGAAMIAIGLG